MGSIGDYLRDFSRDEASAGNASLAAFAFERMDAGSDCDAGCEIDDAVDPQALIDDAYRRGREAAYEETRAMHAAALQAERERHAAEIAEVRRFYEEKQAGEIADAISELRRDLARVVSEDVGAVLIPFLDDELRERAMDRLSSLLAEAVADGEIGTVRVRGPRELYEALQARVGESDLHSRYTESEEIDLAVEIDGTLFATRLGDWRDALKEFDA